MPARGVYMVCESRPQAAAISSFFTSQSFNYSWTSCIQVGVRSLSLVWLSSWLRSSLQQPKLLLPVHDPLGFAISKHLTPNISTLLSPSRTKSSTVVISRTSPLQDMSPPIAAKLRSSSSKVVSYTVMVFLSPRQPMILLYLSPPWTRPVTCLPSGQLPVELPSGLIKPFLVVGPAIAKIPTLVCTSFSHQHLKLVNRLQLAPFRLPIQ